MLSPNTPARPDAGVRTVRVLVVALCAFALLGLASCSRGKKGDFAAGLAAYETGNYALALKEFKPLAEGGNAEAQFKLAEIHMKAQGVALNGEEFLKWCRKAAERGHAEAQFTLGMHYARGGLVRENHAEAKNWFLKAADQGHAESLGYLALLLDSGNGVKRDPVAAHALYTLHARKTEAEGKRTLISGERLSAQLTPGQMEDGRALAERWAGSDTVFSRELGSR